MPIRLRLALAFTVAAATLVAIGAWLFVSLVSSALLSSIDAQLVTAAGLASRYTTPGTASGSAARTAGLPGQYVLQLVDGSGRVRAASPDAGYSPILGSQDLRSARSHRIVVTRTVEEEPMRVVGEPYAGHPGWTAVAAVTLGGYNHNVGDIETGAVLAGVAVAVIAAVGSYALAGRALAPVERMRREVTALSTGDDGSRIPVPSTNDELATLARTMNDLLDRLHGALEREQSFVADASHELRTPLAVLSGELELAARPGRSTTELVAAVHSAAEEVDRLVRLTRDLLLLARSDSGHLPIQRATVDLAPLLDRALRAAAGRSSGRAVRVEASVEPGLRVSIDPDRVRQAVDNLLDNALRAAPGDSTVELRGGIVAGRLVIEVLDRGPGFPSDYLPVAFERFRRPGGDRGRDDGGSGLGLAIVRAIAEAHGGTAEARNRPGGGASVRLDLPLPTGSA